MMVDCGGDIFGREWPFGDVGAVFVGCSQNHATWEFAASHQHTEGMAPVVTACVDIHAGRASEFSHRDNQCLVVETTIDQVSNEGGQGSIEWRQRIPVSPLVSNVRNDSPDCLQPVRPQRGLFD